ncbi:alpha-L-fucosidase [Haloferula luteola]|uniref:alpha-L-fucosidase n=1 Tax=Haloferula luteola TaxID=595692 RepID=A0A840V0R7_9BACT|nr:alpha-L-fucosidase [Haloferula luteola]MBB5351585.1 alpha-L-fucosidase [Haloferula luteola]
MTRFTLLLALLGGAIWTPVKAAEPTRSLHALQEDFVNLRFGMFIHFNMPTFFPGDWPDPDASPEAFTPRHLDCDQWAEAAVSAHMSYGCLTTKHHSGFCIWDTRTTDYSSMHSPVKRDVVKEYVEAFRKRGLKTMLYYSMLDTHHRIRPGHIKPENTEMILQQLTELLTHYGEIDALVIDGWDAPWSRISYEEIPFERIYLHIKSLQPNCLVMDLNAAKYPADALFYGDIKPYEQNAGQHISKETNRLPAMSCLPLNGAWFWEPRFPEEPVKDPQELVEKNLRPFNEAYCNFMLNVSPNADGKLDDNALVALKEMGEMWEPSKKRIRVPDGIAPIVASNLAKGRPAESSWSDDMWIMDFANDDDFGTSWISHPSVEKPWWEVELGKGTRFNMITLFEAEPRVESYKLEFWDGSHWKTLAAGRGEKQGRLTVHRFEEVEAEKVRIEIEKFHAPPVIAEFGVYHETR